MVRHNSREHNPEDIDTHLFLLMIQREYPKAPAGDHYYGVRTFHFNCDLERGPTGEIGSSPCDGNGTTSLHSIHPHWTIMKCRSEKSPDSSPKTSWWKHGIYTVIESLKEPFWWPCMTRTPGRQPCCSGVTSAVQALASLRLLRDAQREIKVSVQHKAPQHTLLGYFGY